MSNYRWLNDLSLQFLQNGYLLPGQTVDERVDIIANKAEQILGIPGYAAKFKDYFQKGWYSLSTPIWTNFGNQRGSPISCFSSNISDSLESILYTQAEIGMLTKIGGGTAAYFGNLRPRGSSIKDNGVSSGAVHFMQLFDKTMSVVSQGNCYIEGTEVLTNHGFKDFRNILPTDKIAQLDEYNNISFTEQYELVSSDFTGHLFCLKGKKAEDLINLKVTPNHRMVISRRKMKKGIKYWPEATEIMAAENLNIHRDTRIPISGYGGDGVGLSTLDKLRIAYQADGRKDQITRSIRFRFSKQRKIERLIELLTTANINYTIIKPKDGTTNIVLENLEETNVQIKHKYLSSWIKLDQINGVWAAEFLEELALWDGSGDSSTHMSYSSVEKSNIEIVQGIAVLANKRTILSVRPAYGNRKDLFRIGISGHDYVGGDALESYSEYYSGKVYCAIVPEGRLLVRYKGRTCVCGNTRRGNFAAYLPIDHGDIEEFLTIRAEGSPIQDISFGVCVPEGWMQSMIDGDSAKRTIWAKVIESRINTGYPYICFVDNVNNNKPEVYKDNNLEITHSNLCQEIALPTSLEREETFVCDLSSMNVVHYDEWKNTDAVETLVYFLDAVMSEFIEKAQKIPFAQRAVKFAIEHRALGIGWIGWHTLLQNKMIPFESMEAGYLNVEIAKVIQAKAIKGSQELFEKYGASDLMRPYKRRNSTLLAIAPTKSSSFILGQVSEGIEPNRTNYDVKDLQKGKFTLKNRALQALLVTKGHDTPEVWNSILQHGGSVQHLAILSDHEKAVFKTFAEISPMSIIVQASQRQKYIDQGQSLNLMIHSSVPVKEINQLLIQGWKLGIKGFYYQIGFNAAQNFSRSILTCSSCES